MGNDGQKKPLVTVSVACYNEARFIRKSLESLLAQDYTEIEYHISDNASTDETWEICKEFAARDARISIHRHDTNLGVFRNGLSLLERANGAYHMWAGAHDLWHPSYISRAVEIMERESAVVMVYARAMRIDARGTEIGLTKNTFDFRGIPVVERFKHLIWNMTGGDVIWALHRTAAMRAVPFRPIWGNDQGTIAALTLMGEIAHITEPLFYWRVVRDESSQARAKTLPTITEPARAAQIGQQSLPELWGELAAYHQELVENANLSEFDKQTLKMEVVRCFKTRYQAMWTPARGSPEASAVPQPARAAPENGLRVAPRPVLTVPSAAAPLSRRAVLLTTSSPPAQTPFSTLEKRPPIGIGFLISVLRNAGHTVHFVDNYLRQTDVPNIDYLRANNIEFVGIYINTICFRHSLAMMYRLDYYRRRGWWKGKIMVGGPHTTVAVETIPEFVDYIVQGEGEQAILDIVEDRVNDRIVTYPRVMDLDTLPRPAWDVFANKPYHWDCNFFPGNGVFSMNTSRGCPFKCGFCSVCSIWGKKYSMFSAERIVDDIAFLIKTYGAKGIYFREDNFTLNKKRLERFCELMIQREIKIPWVCESRVNTLTAGNVKLMARAGVRGFYFGVESGSQRLLDFMEKDITVDQIRQAFAWCKEYGISTAASIITGVPTETEDDVRETQALIREIKPTISWYNVFVGIPTSKLYHHTLENNLQEFMDDRGLVYLKGHNERAKRFYGNVWDASVPVSFDENGVVNPKISVVMAVHNGERYLDHAVKSVLAQTEPNFEVIIVDDASSDGSAAILDSFDDRRIKPLKNERNLGLTASLVRGCAVARGTYIARMDADDVSLPMRFETQVRYLETHRDIAAVGSAFYHIGDTGKIRGIISQPTDSATIAEGLVRENKFCHGSMMMRREAYERAGGYDQSYRFSQDYDLWLRMSETARLANIEEPLYSWRDTAACISRARATEQKACADRARQAALERRAERRNAHGVAVTGEPPLVSVIVPTYNRPALLGRTIESVLKQTYPNFEIVVVNDAGAAVEGIVTALNASNNIMYLRHKKNAGLAAARNTGIRAARGSLIGYLDDDDIYYPDHLESVMDVIRRERTRAAYADSCMATQKLINGQWETVDRRLVFSVDFNADQLLVRNLFPVLCMVHEKALLDETGLFDESFSTHEDWDLWIRLSQISVPRHIAKVTSEYTRRDGVAESMTSDPHSTFNQTRARIYEKYRHLSENRPDILHAQERERVNADPALRQQAVLMDQFKGFLADIGTLVEKGDLDAALRCYENHRNKFPLTFPEIAQVDLLMQRVQKMKERAGVQG